MLPEDALTNSNTIRDGIRLPSRRLKPITNCDLHRHVLR